MIKLAFAALLSLALALLLSASGCHTEAEQHYNFGTSAQDSRHYIQAMKEYSEAIRLDPEYAMAYYNRGYAYYDLGQHERAIQDYNEAVRLGGPLDFWTEYK